MAEESQVKNEAPRKKIFSWKRLLFILCILLLVSPFLYRKIMATNIKYNKAVELYDNHDYVEALALFSELKGYKYSDNIILDIELNIRYDDAISSFENSHYDIAISKFEELEGFKDSSYMIEKSIYYKALSYVRIQDWTLAIETISKIPDFDNSKELVLKYRYNLGLQKANAKDWNSAIEIMSSLVDYDNSNQLLLDYTYHMALEKAYDYDWQSAIDILSIFTDQDAIKELIRQYNINISLNIKPSISKEFIVPQEPTSITDFAQIIIDMLKSNETYREIFYDVSYDDDYINNTLISNISKAGESTIAKFPEYRALFYKVKGYKISAYNEIVIGLDILSNNFRNNIALEMNNEFRNESYNIIEQLIKDGKLTSSMNDREKAKVLYKWVAHNLQYDLNLSDEGFTGYGAAINKIASCQGYTSLYNLLCKIVGIDVEGVIGLANINTDTPDYHIWTLANLDGEMLYIDSTWGDPTPDTKNYCDMTYFAVTKEFLSETHEFND